MIRGPLLALATVVAYLVLPGAVALARGRRRRHLIGGAAVVALVLGGVALVSRSAQPVVGPYALVIANGLAISGCIALLALPGIGFPIKYGVTGLLAGALAVQWAAILPLGPDVSHDVGSRSLVWALGWLGRSPGEPALEGGVRWILASIELVNEHPIGVAVFFTWTGTLALLALLYATLPWVFEPNEPPWSPSALLSIRLGPRAGLPVLLALVATGGLVLDGRAARVSVVVAEVILASYAAWAVLGLVVLARRSPPWRAPVGVALLACAVHLPTVVLLGLGGLADHVVGLRDRLTDPGRRSASAPFRGTPRGRPWVAAVAVYLAVFAFVHPAIDAEHRPPAGPWVGSVAPTEVAGGYAPGPPGTIFQGRAGAPFWIDEYEHPGTPELPPRAHVRFVDALDVCRREGKRPCAEEEWLYACEDLARLRGDPERDPRRTCLPGAGDPGAVRLAECRSRSGVHGLLGGVWEWTEGQDGSHVLKGVSTAAADDVRFSCRHRFVVHPLQESALDLSDVGVRCCADAVRLED